MGIDTLLYLPAACISCEKIDRDDNLGLRLSVLACRDTAALTQLRCFQAEVMAAGQRSVQLDEAIQTLEEVEKEARTQAAETAAQAEAAAAKAGAESGEQAAHEEAAATGDAADNHGKESGEEGEQKEEENGVFGDYLSVADAGEDKQTGESEPEGDGI